MKKRVLIFIVAYNAEKTIADVLTRIPDEVLERSEYDVEVLIIDDCSQDDTFELGSRYARERGKPKLTTFYNPVNLGYGGNQKLGYRYALDHGFDIVVLLHGDGQYAPESLPELLEPLLKEECDAVFGSRMMPPGRPIKGGMPLYKFVGNKILTALQNRMLGGRLSEWHSGYRLYSTRALAKVPFERNSNDFDFDTDIIIQLLLCGLEIRELPIPTFYGDEISHVQGIPYAMRILRSCLAARLQPLGIAYDPKFDLARGPTHYDPKYHFASSDSYALEALDPDDRVACIGSGAADAVVPLLERAAAVAVVAAEVDAELEPRGARTHRADLDDMNLGALLGTEEFSKVLALDVIEHRRSPEAFLQQIRSAPALAGSLLILTTPNIAFFTMRAMLLLGQFNYSRRGILDLTHRRLFTFRSLKRLLQQEGFEIRRMRGVPAPFPLALGSGWMGRLLLGLNRLGIALMRSLFSYQIYVEAVPAPTTQVLLERTRAAAAARTRESADAAPHP